MLRRGSGDILRIYTAAVLMRFCCGYAKINVKTVFKGQTVMEPVLKKSALEIDDQLFTFFQGNSTSKLLFAEYFCENGICDNLQTGGQFKVQGEDIVLVIKNVNITNSGEYCVSLNNLQVVCTFTLEVQESTDQKKNTTEKEIFLSSVLTWLIAVIIITVVLLAIIGVICLKKKMYPGREPPANQHELTNPSEPVEPKCCLVV
ncbi:uncharacterized protein [Misgurnus anguillicaudatus]|uniref:uncharacterized protein n=1 Tax=Misgurnus anguillicaudatus TaxID=75329 RepID=UPI003CCF58D0